MTSPAVAAVLELLFMLPMIRDRLQNPSAAKLFLLFKPSFDVA